MADSKTNDDIVRLGHASNPAEAEAWKEALEAEGIRCNVVGEYLEMSFGGLPRQEREVWVHREDLDRAQAIINDHQRNAVNPFDDEDEDEDEDDDA